MIVVFGASQGAVVKLACPKCGEVQARARQPEGARYTCRRCGEVFEVEIRDETKSRNSDLTGR